MNKTIKVPAPKFELYELVTLHWNGIEYPTRIVEASFRLSGHEWVYQVAQCSNEIDEERFFNESVLEAQKATAP
jgi:hypothetical protein